ncbi:MAG: Ig-like domain-containing protein [Bacteroidales bacterium]
MRKKNEIVRANSHLGKAISHYVLIMALQMIIAGAFIPGCTKDNGNGPLTSDLFTSADVQEIYPVNEAESVAINSVIGVTFKTGTVTSKITSASLTLKTGNLPIPGNVTIAGNSVYFDYGDKLEPLTEYSATLNTTRKTGSGQEESVDLSWKFKTGKDREDKSLSVVSVTPANQTTSVPLATMVTVTFNKDVKPWMKSLISINMNAGAAAVAWSVSFEGNKAIFDPSADLLAGTIYSCSFVYGNFASGNNDTEDDDDEDEGDDDKSGNYTWTFTTIAGEPGTSVTPDVKAPEINAVAPANNAAAVSTSAALSATFSEAMNPATINTTTFVLKQGTTAVNGSVTYSGTTAKFTPSSPLAGSTTYTATITTGAKDVAGNPIVADYTWNFTTAAAPPAAAGLSFSGDVIPVLNKCNGCHTHPWTTSSVASTYYTNLVNGGYVNPTTYTSSKIYVKLSGGHAVPTVPRTDVDKIINWMKEGSKNN